MSHAAGTQHLAGAGDHDVAALRLQIQVEPACSAIATCAGWWQCGL